MCEWKNFENISIHRLILPMIIANHCRTRLQIRWVDNRCKLAVRQINDLFFQEESFWASVLDELLNTYSDITWWQKKKDPVEKAVLSSDIDTSFWQDRRLSADRHFFFSPSQLILMRSNWVNISPLEDVRKMKRSWT